MVVYADVLVILNLYINYFLIRSTALLTRRDISAKRCVSGALAGAFGALVILLPELPFWAVALEKILLGVLITFIVFGRQKPLDLAICGLFFLVASFVFAGVMLALWTFAAPLGMVYSNGVCCFNIPLAAVAAFTVTAYCCVRLVRLFADKRLRCGRICAVKLRGNGVEIAIRGLCDTGNELCDIFGGKPVIVCEFGKIREIIPENVLDYLNGNIAETVGIRLIPCRTVASETLIPIFKTEKIIIDGKPADALIGVSKAPLGSGVDCVFNPKIISI